MRYPWACAMFGNRRFARYPVNLRLRLQLPAGELETTTEDISLAGFSAPCPDLPEVGTTFGFVVHLPDGRTVSGTASAMRVSDDGLAGFSCEFAPAELPAWESFLQQEQASGGVWRMIARYASSSGEDAEAARSVLEKGPFGILFKRIGGAEKKDAEAEAPTAIRLHMVGENGEAYRVAFEKHPSEPPEASAFASASPRVLELVRRACSRILSQDVFLKRSPQARVEPVRLVELSRGGFGFVVQHPGGKPGLMGLHGSELIAVEVNGKPVFPFFDAQDLERIACDTFRREPEEARAAPADKLASPLREERFSPAYAHKVVNTRDTARTSEDELRRLIAASPRVQTRTYGQRTLKLFPDLWLEVERPKAWPGPVRGFTMEDGPALCVFVLEGKDAPRVVRLEAGDLLSLIRAGGEG
ncbi:MAG: PilZ domain-containing protein [Myxococcota bacterium]